MIEKRANELGSPAFALTEDMYEMQKKIQERALIFPFIVSIIILFNCRFHILHRTR